VKTSIACWKTRARAALTRRHHERAELRDDRLVDEALLTHGGRERSVAATKTFTGQMIFLYAGGGIVGAAAAVGFV
jgi:glucosamine 6-phosphate synthetase-like amidotransferase/phosphosugar isomerase protein